MRKTENLEVDIEIQGWIVRIAVCAAEGRNEDFVSLTERAVTGL